VLYKSVCRVTNFLKTISQLQSMTAGKEPRFDTAHLEWITTPRGRKWLLALSLLILVCAVTYIFHSATERLPGAEDQAATAIHDQFVQQAMQQLQQQQTQLPVESLHTLAEGNWNEAKVQQKETLQIQRYIYAAQTREYYSYPSGADQEFQTYMYDVQAYSDWHATTEPVGKPLHTKLEAGIYALTRGITGRTDTHGAAAILPVVLLVITAALVFFIGYYVSGALGGFVAGMFIAVHPLLLQTTWYGSAPLTAWSVLFAALTMLFLLLALKLKRGYNALAAFAAGLSSAALAALPLTAAIMFGITLTLVLFVGVAIFKKQKQLRTDALFILGGFVLGALLVAAPFHAHLSLPLQTASLASAGAMLFLLSGIGLVFFCVQRTIQQREVIIISGLLIILLGVLFFQQSVPALLLMSALSIIAVGIIILTKTAVPPTRLLVFSWLLVILFSIPASQSTLLVLPCALLAGVALSWIAQSIYKYKRPWISVAVVGAILVILFNPVFGSVAESRTAIEQHTPVINDVWWNTMQTLRSQTPADTIVVTAPSVAPLVASISERTTRTVEQNDAFIQALQQPGAEQLRATICDNCTVVVLMSADWFALSPQLQYSSAALQPCAVQGNTTVCPLHIPIDGGEVSHVQWATLEQPQLILIQNGNTLLALPSDVAVFNGSMVQVYSTGSDTAVGAIIRTAPTTVAGLTELRLLTSSFTQLYFLEGMGDTVKLSDQTDQNGARIVAWQLP
jgi:hypothetical protein